MKWITLPLAVLLVFSTACLEFYSKKGAYKLKNVGSVTELSVMTFNILSTADLGAIAEGYPTWGQRKDGIYALIEGQDPDLLSIQEASPTQYEEFYDRFAGRYRFIHHKSVTTDAFIMFKEDRFALLEKGYEVLETLLKLRIPRLAVWAKLRDRSSQREFMFLGTHLDGNSFKGHEITQIKNVFKGQEDSGAPLIFAGDMNATYETTYYAQIVAGNWRDSYVGLIGRTEVKTFSTKNLTRRIDHVFFFGQDVQPTFWHAFSPDGIDLSDHLPVLVKLHIDSAKNL